MGMWYDSVQPSARDNVSSPKTAGVKDAILARRRNMRQLIAAIALVALCLSTLAFAKPPDRLMQVILTTATVVHDDTCVVEEMSIGETECLILFNEKDKIVYIVLFTPDCTEIVQVIEVKDKKLTTLWISEETGLGGGTKI